MQIKLLNFNAMISNLFNMSCIVLQLSKLESAYNFELRQNGEFCCPAESRNKLKQDALIFKVCTMA